MLLSFQYGKSDGQNSARQYDHRPLTGSLVLTHPAAPGYDEGSDEGGSLGAWRGGAELEGGRGDEAWDGEEEFEQRPEDVPSNENR